MSGSTWTWVGGTINIDSPGDWSLTGGPGNSEDIPEAGDTAINNGTLLGVGVIAAALVNNGTVEASNNGVPVSSTGGDLEIQGAVSGTGSMTIEPGATLRLDGTLGVGQSIVFAPGTPETLILGSPTGTITNAIGGFAAGDRIEFSNGITINSDFAAVPAGTTLTVTYHTASGTGTYLLTNVAFSGDGPVEYLTQTDFATGDPTLTLTTFMTWVGANGANFSAPSSWNFGTIVPSVQNFVTFNNSAGGTIGGTGTVQGFNFNNGGTWSLAAGATLVSANALNVGNGGGGTNSVANLVIGAGSTILSSGYINVGSNAGDVSALTVSGGGLLDETAPGSAAAAMEVANGTASGTLAAPTANVLVTGAGSMLNLGTNALYIANGGGNGNVTVSQGGSIIATSYNDNVLDPLSIGSHGNGTLTVTGSGSQVTANGVAYLAHTGTGTLTVENSGSVLIAPDPLGLVGMFIGNGNQNGVGGTAVATVTSNGVLDDEGYLDVGLRGTEGQLNVSNGGIVQVGNTLYVGQGGTIPTAGTIAAGTTEIASGTLTVGAGGTVELTGGPQTTSYGVYLASANNTQVSATNGIATVSGAGALLNTDGNGISLGQYGTADLTVSLGGSGRGNRRLEPHRLARGRPPGRRHRDRNRPELPPHRRWRCLCRESRNRQPDRRESGQRRDRPRWSGGWRPRHWRRRHQFDRHGVGGRQRHRAGHLQRRPVQPGQYRCRQRWCVRIADGAIRRRRRGGCEAADRQHHHARVRRHDHFAGRHHERDVRDG
jgi:T5SS/PEP-CTERM-associated repeat protein